MRRGRLLGALVVVAGFLVSSAGPARADGNWCDSNDFRCEWAGHTYVSSADCPWLHTEIDAYGGAPHMSSYGSLDWYGSGRWCGNTGAIAWNPTYLDIIQQLYIWNQSAGRWDLCNYGVWVATSWGHHSVTTGYAWPSSSPPCGPGYYGDEAAAASSRDGSNWHGLQLYWTGYIQPIA